MLEAIDPSLHPPRPVRETGISPWQAEAPSGELGSFLGELTREESAAIGAGNLAVIVPADRLDELTRAVGVAVPDAVLDDTSLDRPVVVLSVKQVRGLEFDSVLVADPARIVADSTFRAERPLRGHHQGHPAPRRRPRRRPARGPVPAAFPLTGSRAAAG